MVDHPVAPDPSNADGWVLLELLAGIMALSMAFSILDLPVIATFVSDICSDALAFIAHHWPNAVNMGDIFLITYAQIAHIVKAHPFAKFASGGGPPCQGVSIDQRSRGWRI